MGGGRHGTGHDCWGQGDLWVHTAGEGAPPCPAAEPSQCPAHPHLFGAGGTQGMGGGGGVCDTPISTPSPGQHSHGVKHLLVKATQLGPS